MVKCKIMGDVNDKSHMNKAWINIAKICSIGGVVLQHVRGYVHSNEYIIASVLWVVTLFTMLGGYNSLSSYENRGRFLLKKKLLGIIMPYFFATVMYLLYDSHFLDATVLLQKLITFKATGPLYYVAVYMQLIIITPFLIGIINLCERNNRMLRFILVWVLIIAISYCTTHYTNIFDIAIGGGNLFAGPWLLFWFAGMSIRYVEKGITLSQRQKKYALVLLTVMIAGWQYLFVNRGMNSSLGHILNSRQVGLTWANALETLLIFFWFRLSVEMFENAAKGMGKWVLKPLDFMGRHSLYIFLYHMLFFRIYRDYLEVQGRILNRWLCMSFTMIAPVLFGLLLKRVKTVFSTLMKNVMVE